jgi:hypothetical protein
LAIALSVCLQFIASGYPFGIFKLFLGMSWCNTCGMNKEEFEDTTEYIEECLIQLFKFENQGGYWVMMLNATFNNISTTHIRIFLYFSFDKQPFNQTLKDIFFHKLSVIKWEYQTFHFTLFIILMILLYWCTSLSHTHTHTIHILAHKLK